MTKETLKRATELARGIEQIEKMLNSDGRYLAIGYWNAYSQKMFYDSYHMEPGLGLADKVTELLKGEMERLLDELKSL